MDLCLREIFLSQHEHTGIGDDQGVRSKLPQFLKIFRCARQIRIVSQDIGSDMYLHPVGMGIGNALCHVLMGKILCLCPQTVGLSADIDRICPEMHSRL